MENNKKQNKNIRLSKVYRGALIGCGYVSSFQLQAWSRIKGVEIVALSSRNQEKLKERAAEFDIPALYTDFRAMLDTESLDFVDIATPPNVHPEMVGEAADRGLHVLCQKPIAETLFELKEMIRICEKAKVLFMVNENCRFQPWFRKMKALLDKGVIGKPFYANMYCRWRGSFLKSRFEGQPFFTSMPRLVIYELGIHYLDTLRYLFKEPKSVYARARRVCRQITGEELAVLVLGIEDLTAVIDLSWASVPSYEHDQGFSWGEYRIEGDKGTLYLRKDGLLRLITDDEEQQFQFPADSELLSYQATQAHFIDCLRSGAEPETGGSETLKTMELVFGAYDSAANNRIYQVSNDQERLR